MLVIEDDEAFRNALCEALRAHGHRVSDASGGRQALESVDLQDIDLVFTDLVMEDGEGVETLRRMRRRAPDLPVIAMSGNPMYLDLIAKLGATRTIEKPFHGYDALTLIDELLPPQ